MHEISLCQNIVEIVCEQAADQHFSSVKSICLGVGVLANIEKSSLLFGFDCVTKGTIVEGAKLNICDIPAKARCIGCGQEVEISSFNDCCVYCGGKQLTLLSGQELIINSLEVE